MINSTIRADLKGKVALVTGASQGLGAFYAELFAQNGAKVIVQGRPKSAEQVHQVVAKLQQKGYQAKALIFDMTAFDEFDAKATEAWGAFGHVDILVNNAAVSIDKDIFSILPKDWDLHMDTNLKGLFFWSQAIASRMKAHSRAGSIVNIAALNGEKVRKNCISFGVSKAGVVHLTKSMAYELLPYHIRVNALSLGLFKSDVVEKFLKNDPGAQDYLERIPAKRPGEFEELAGPMLLLVSDASAYMSGSVIRVDGGFASDIFMSLDIKNV